MKSPWHPHRRKGRDGRQRTRDHSARFDGMRLCRERGPIAPHDATLPMNEKRGRNIGDDRNDHRTGPVSHSGSVTVTRQIASPPTYRPVMPASYLHRAGGSAHHGLCRMADLTEGQLRLDRLAATAFRNFLPLAAAPPFLANQESSGPAVLRCAAALKGALPLASGWSIAIEATVVAAR